MTTLVCIHGRGQGGRNPDELRRKWAAGLNFGLTAAGRRTVNPDKVVLPFYGDLLESARLQAQRTGADLDEQAGADDIQQEGWEERILKIPGARRILQVLADRTDVEQEVIEAFLTDVAVYYKVARDRVLDAVRVGLPAGEEPLVLVAHSLGGVVARDLLDDPAVRDRTRLLVTVGSPLGLQACYRNLLAGGPVHPKVAAWVATWDQDDFVALGHPLKRLYGDPLEDLRVDNPANRAHAIEYYLGHARVAARIADALG
jgi:endonuclease G